MPECGLRVSGTAVASDRPLDGPRRILPEPYLIFCLNRQPYPRGSGPPQGRRHGSPARRLDPRRLHPDGQSRFWRKLSHSTSHSIAIRVSPHPLTPAACAPPPITPFLCPNFRIYRMELAQGTGSRFLFPFFEKLHWYAADVILGRLTSKSTSAR